MDRGTHARIQAGKGAGGTIAFWSIALPEPPETSSFAGDKEGKRFLLDHQTPKLNLAQRRFLIDAAHSRFVFQDPETGEFVSKSGGWGHDLTEWISALEERLEVSSGELARNVATEWSAAPPPLKPLPNLDHIRFASPSEWLLFAWFPDRGNVAGVIALALTAWGSGVVAIVKRARRGGPVPHAAASADSRPQLQDTPRRFTAHLRERAPVPWMPISWCPDQTAGEGVRMARPSLAQERVPASASTGTA
jgi:hypothetical protein